MVYYTKYTNHAKILSKLWKIVKNKNKRIEILIEDAMRRDTAAPSFLELGVS
jgi:hypothetical protein